MVGGGLRRCRGRVCGALARPLPGTKFRAVVQIELVLGRVAGGRGGVRARGCKSSGCAGPWRGMVRRLPVGKLGREVAGGVCARSQLVLGRVRRCMAHNRRQARNARDAQYASDVPLTYYAESQLAPEGVEVNIITRASAAAGAASTLTAASRRA